MTLRVETVFEFVDEEWLNWYLARLQSAESCLPGADLIAEELRECGHAAYSWKDPESRVVGTTTYQIEGKTFAKAAKGQE